jgi:hypothetical protein
VTKQQYFSEIWARDRSLLPMFVVGSGCSAHLHTAVHTSLTVLFERICLPVVRNHGSQALPYHIIQFCPNRCGWSRFGTTVRTCSQPTCAEQNWFVGVHNHGSTCSATAPFAYTMFGWFVVRCSCESTDGWTIRILVLPRRCVLLVVVLLY